MRPSLIEYLSEYDIKIQKLNISIKGNKLIINALIRKSAIT